jgi:hypothetical protein
MGLFSRKKSAPMALINDAARVIGPTTEPLSARQGLQIVEKFANAQSVTRRLILVLSGTDLQRNGTANTWQYLFVYPEERAEATFSLHNGSHGDHKNETVVFGEITPWPTPGSPQESMLLHQGPTARIIVEQQWADRLDRLPGLPERFIDSPMALRQLMEAGANWDHSMLSPAMKGRTLPGNQAVWELTLGEGIFRTRFV